MVLNKIRILERDHLSYKGNIVRQERHIGSEQFCGEFTRGSFCGKPGKAPRGYGEV